ncbi:MAG: tyrosine-type recombinase/integrase [Ferruginibacter sp.]
MLLIKCKSYHVKKNELSKNALGENQLYWLEENYRALLVGNYSKESIRGYLSELRLLFHYYHEKNVEDITQQDITQYIIFIKSVHGVGLAKCRSVAHSCSFFFKKVIQKPFVLPTILYPRKVFVLPAVMTQLEIKQLYSSLVDVRQKVVISLLYGTGMRLNELRNLKWQDIERSNQRIKIRQGKGAKDRFTLLSPTIVKDLESYYRKYKTQTYVFESILIKSKPLHSRSLQTIVNAAMVKAGFVSGKYTAHTLRHSFATHLLDNGCDINTIKILLGHADLRTTGIYLHLQQSKRDCIISPLEFATHE